MYILRLWICRMPSTYYVNLLKLYYVILYYIILYFNIHIIFIWLTLVNHSYSQDQALGQETPSSKPVKSSSARLESLSLLEPVQQEPATLQGGRESNPAFMIFMVVTGNDQMISRYTCVGNYRSPWGMLSIHSISNNALPLLLLSHMLRWSHVQSNVKSQDL